MKNGNEIAVIVPYFGSQPYTTKIWLMSASCNKRIDFHLIGDCFSDLETPSNVKVHYWSFDKLNLTLQSKLGAKHLVSPYKLCDFKPAYGVLFSEYLEGYEVWGFSDLDLIYGDIIKTVQFHALPTNWGRVFNLGHLSFFPSGNKIAWIFAQLNGNPSTWSFVKNSRLVWVYDESYHRGLGGVNGIIEGAGYDIIPNSHLVSDVITRFKGFFDQNTGGALNLFYSWENGRIWKVSILDGEEVRSELTYVHFQKRIVRFLPIGSGQVLIVPEHWDRIHDYTDAIRTLAANKEKDTKLRSSLLRRQRLLRLKKWIRFIPELLILRGSIPALIRFLRNSSAKH